MRIRSTPALLVMWACCALLTFAAHAPAAAMRPADAPRPAAAMAAWSWDGMWMGRTSGATPQLDVVLDITGGATPEMKVTLVAAGIMQQPFGSVTLAESAAQAKWTMGGTGLMAIDLTHAAGDDNSAEGVLHLEPPGMKQGINHTLKLVRKPRVETVPGAEHWVSKIEIPGGELQIGLVLAQSANGGPVGSFSVPAQGLTAYPIIAERSGPAWNLEVPLPVSARMILAPVEDRLEGRFQQGTVDVGVVFTKGEAKAAAPKVKPQTPKQPYPYTEAPVTVRHPAGHTLAGTLTLPPGASPTAKCAAVVFATGSGPQNRNEAIMGHEPFLVLSDALTRAGIAVLRVDDRGIGESTGVFSNASSIDFASDMKAAFEFLKTQPAIDPARVGLLGHSEGALLAMITAADAGVKAAANPPAFVVLMAGPGVPGGEVLKIQNEALLKAFGVEQAQVAEEVKAHRAFIDAAVAGADDDELLKLGRELIALQLARAAKGGQAIPPGSEESEARKVLVTMRSPWMKTFLTLDPAEYLKQVKAPVLALNGAIDTQVIAAQNLPAIQAALAASGAPLTVKKYPGLNHLFQPAKTGGVDEYAKIETTVSPQVMNDIAAWIRERTGTTTEWKPDVPTP